MRALIRQECKACQPCWLRTWDPFSCRLLTSNISKEKKFCCTFLYLLNELLLLLLLLLEELLESRWNVTKLSSLTTTVVSTFMYICPTFMSTTLAAWIRFPILLLRRRRPEIYVNVDFNMMYITAMLLLLLLLLLDDPDLQRIGKGFGKCFEVTTVCSKYTCSYSSWASLIRF
jgi:hypothetical protein